MNSNACRRATHQIGKQKLASALASMALGCALVLTVTSSVRATEDPTPPDLALDESLRQSIIERIVTTFDEYYIDAEVAHEICGKLRAKSAARDYRQLERLERTLGWLEATRDRDHGEWFGSLQPDGSLGSYGPNKGDEWKASYHNLRSLLFTADWIGEALESG